MNLKELTEHPRIIQYTNLVLMDIEGKLRKQPFPVALRPNVSGYQLSTQECEYRPVRMGDDLFQEFYSDPIIERIRNMANMKPKDTEGTMSLTIATSPQTRTTKIHLEENALGHFEFSLA